MKQRLHASEAPFALARGEQDELKVRAANLCTDNSVGWLQWVCRTSCGTDFPLGLCSPSAHESVSQLAVAIESEIWHEEACRPINRILRIKPRCCPRM